MASRVDSSERVWAAGFSGVHSGKALIREGLGSEDCGSPGYPLSKKPRSVASSGPYDVLMIFFDVFVKHLEDSPQNGSCQGLVCGVLWLHSEAFLQRTNQQDLAAACCS